MLGMGDGLTIEAGLEVTRSDAVDKHSHENAHDGNEQREILHEEQVADATHEADARLLGQGANDKSDNQGDGNGSMLGARAFGARSEHGGRNADDEQNDEHDGKHGAGHLARVGFATQREAALQEQGARDSASGQAHQANPSVQVAGSHADNHAQRAAQEDQGTNHHDEAQDEANHGRRTRRRAEFLRGQGNQERAHHEAHNFGAEILHGSSRMQLQGARHIADEARGANGHVRRIAEERERGNKRAHKHANDGKSLLRIEKLHVTPFFRMPN